MQLELTFDLEAIVHYFDFDQGRDNRISKIYTDLYQFFDAFYISTERIFSRILSQLEKLYHGNLYGGIFGYPINLKTSSVSWREELVRKVNQTEEEPAQPYRQEILLIDKLTQSLNSVLRHFYRESIKNIPEELRASLNEDVDKIPYRVILDEEARKFIDWLGKNPEADRFVVGEHFKEDLSGLFNSIKTLSDFYKDGRAGEISDEMWRFFTIDYFNDSFSKRFGRESANNPSPAACIQRI